MIDNDADDTDGILKNPPEQVHAMAANNLQDQPVEDVETLMRHIQEENRYGDLAVSPDDPMSYTFDAALFAQQMADGGEW